MYKSLFYVDIPSMSFSKISLPAII